MIPRKQAEFYYRNSNAPTPNRPNHIGVSVLIESSELKCSSESKALRFFTKDELKNLKIAETHIPIIEDHLEK